MNNLPDIPTEVYEPMVNVASNLLDKLQVFCGWVVQPKGRKKDREDAINYMISEIQKDPKKPLLVKGAEIANARKILKEYENQNDIVYIALEELSVCKGADMVQEEWLDYFMDKARLVNSDKLKIIWGKLLAEENITGSVPKKLIHILSVISAEDAADFNQICRYYVEIENIEGMDGCLQIFDLNEVGIERITRLASYGLLDMTMTGYTMTIYSEEKNPEIIWKYHDKHAKIRIPDDKFKMGKVRLTKEGQILQKMISNEEHEGVLERILEQYSTDQKEIY